MTDIIIILKLTQANLKTLWPGWTYFIANPSTASQWLPEIACIRRDKNNHKTGKKKQRPVWWEKKAVVFLTLILAVAPCRGQRHCQLCSVICWTRAGVALSRGWPSFARAWPAGTFQEGTESTGCFLHVARHKGQRDCLRRLRTADTSNRNWQLQRRVGVGWKAVLQRKGGKEKAREDLKLEAANKFLSERAWSWAQSG